MQADTTAGDRLEDLCETAQDAVNEVIRGCREHDNGFCRRTFADLNISVMATAFKDGSVRWSIVSLITDKETKNGHAHGNIIPRDGRQH